jgi:hypothetical protein
MRPRAAFAILPFSAFLLACQAGPRHEHVNASDTGTATAAGQQTTSSSLLKNSPVKSADPPRVSSRLNACSAIESLESGRPGPLARFCATGEAVDSNGCPATEAIAIVVDHDADTAQRRTWNGFIGDLTHIAAACPSGADPLNGHIPYACTTIQALGDDRPFGPCHSGSRTFPDGTPTTPHPDRTPAAEAVGHLCDRIRDGKIGVGIFAFDGVPDGDYNNATPAAAFGERVGQCAADGLVIHVAAVPTQYRYVYIFAASSYAQYAQNVAVGLKTLWDSANTKAVALTVAPAPADRLEFGAPSFERSSKTAAGWDNDQPPITAVQWKGRDVGHRVDVLRWTTNQDTHGAEFVLKWHDTNWQTLSGAGTLASPPELLVNQDIVTPPPANLTVPFVAAADGHAKKLDDCISLRNPAMMAVGSPCGVPVPQIYQRVDIAHNHAAIEIYKGSHPEYVADKLVLTAVLASTGKPMLAMALVAPQLTLDQCLVDLGVALRSTHRWQTSTTASHLDGLEQKGACEASPLRDLVFSFRDVQPMRFKTGSDIFAATTDRRVGMESLTIALRSVADARLKSPAGQACVLTTFRVVLDSCTPQPKVQLTAAN